MEAAMAIAGSTARELIRSKSLYTVFFFAAAMLAVGALFGSVTIGDQVLVIKDFGLFSISICGVAFAVVSGASLLEKELARKTIYNLLAKPVPRWQFIFGKFFGMYSTILLMITLMTIALQAFLLLLTHRLDWELWIGVYFAALELSIICSAALFFSSIVVTPLLSGLFTLGLFVAGRSAEYLLYFVEQGTVKGLLASILEGAYVILPQLAKLQVSNEVVFGLSEQSFERALWGSLYAAGYSGALLAFAVLFFRKRDFN